MAFSLDAPDTDEGASHEKSEMVSPLQTANEQSGECSSPNDVLAALADSDSREILAASAEKQQTVAELVEQCDIPTATAYRKVNALVDAGLLGEHVCIRPYGRNVCKYSLRVESVHAELTRDGVPAVNVSLVTRETKQSEPHALTDGGETADSHEEGHRQRQLRSLFLDVTDTEELVDEQEPDAPTRHIDDDGEGAVSEYVTSVARDDGLSDSLPEPEGDTQA